MTMRQVDIDEADTDGAAEEKAWAQLWPAPSPPKKAGHIEGIAKLKNCSRKWG